MTKPRGVLRLGSGVLQGGAVGAAAQQQGGGYGSSKQA